MSELYSYNIATALPNAKVSLPRLDESLRSHQEEASWTYDYVSCSSDGTTLVVMFESALPQNEVDLLDSIIAAHSGAADTASDVPAKDSEGALVTRLKKASWGKNFCMRPLVFTTSKLSSLVDRIWSGEVQGGAALKFYEEVDGTLVEITAGNLNQTYLDTHCVQTRVEVRYDSNTVEIDTATLFVPYALSGNDDDAWSYAMVIAAITPYAMGVTCLIPLRFHKATAAGQYNKLSIGQSVEVMKVSPDTLGGMPLLGGHVMHFLFNHPIGAQTEFMLEGVCYR